MGDMISSLLFQPPPPTRLKESKVIWLTNSYGKRIPAFFIECPKDERTGEGIRAPLTGETPPPPSNPKHSPGGASQYSKGSGKSGMGHTLSSNNSGGKATTATGSNTTNNNHEGPMQQQQQVPSTPQIRTSKELEMSLLHHGRVGGGSYGGGAKGVNSPCAPTILYSHANAEDLGNIYPWCKFLSKMLGVNIFAYDYTGYGLATDQGDPSEEYCFADVTAAYTYLNQTLQIPAHSILLYGRSLGSGPSCFLAAKTAEDGEAVGGLILHAPFLSVYRIVLESGCTLPGDRFANVDYAPFVRSPVLFIHGTKDSIVPFNHSERLLDTIVEPYRAEPLFIKDMGHNNVHASVRPLFVERLREYLDRHVLPVLRERRKHEESMRSRMMNRVRSARLQQSR
mmetsp:Transcript_28482/g.40679  ORF Transcript_28482/g.40679 Transcript_28482/m.40679 type:complete len:396 (-) Transcript_28482:318-1505(-)